MVEQMNIKQLFNLADMRIAAWMARYGIILMRVALGIVFFWFGILKFFPGLSVADDLATRTISMLSLGYIALD
ncbi:MAG: YkgB family protein [Acidobacteriota bacterium]|nr:YkgB family protein [Acidobacteriota bacterium]